jgi:glycosyltransferase involved in cell wall biosynthesis
MISLSIAQLFTHSAVTRGGAVQGLLLARSLQGRGHRVISFFHAPFEDEGRKFSETFQPFAASDLDLRRINMKNPVNYFSFRRWLQKERVDVIHAHRSLALLFAYFSTLGLPGPVFVANRGTTYPLANPLVKHVFHSRRLDHVIAVAHAVKKTLVEKEGVDAHRISVVYGSFDEKRFYPGCNGEAIRKEFQVETDTPLIVCIASVDPRKGLQFVVQAAAEVTRVMPTAKFLVSGNIDNFRYYRYIQKEIKRMGLQRQVILTGHRSDVPEILAAADVSVNASTEGEGLTGALRESLAMEKPVVCTATCGNPELIQDGETGWVVKIGDAKALARAILEVLRKPKEARRRALAGYRRTTRLCSDEVRSRRIEEIYLHLCQKRYSP